MKLAIMQPYFMPYLGYWQVMNLADQYVVYDDVNYINRGWINRNRILANGVPHYVNIPLRKASQNKKINEIELAFEQKTREKVLRTISLSYSKAPYYNEVYPIIERTIQSAENNLGCFLYEQLQTVRDYLGIETELLLSSELNKDNSLKGEDKILSICELLHAKTYINAIGGMKLYEKEKFRQHGIDLRFLRMDEIEYRQFGEDFVPNLSVIDVVMFNTKEQIKDMLSKYTLLGGIEAG